MPGVARTPWEGRLAPPSPVQAPLRRCSHAAAATWLPPRHFLPRDDKEDAILATVECIEAPEPPQQLAPQQLRPQIAAPPQLARDSGGSGDGGARAGPFLEATAVRVVGCELLQAGSGSAATYLVMYPSRKSGETAAAPL